MRLVRALVASAVLCTAATAAAAEGDGAHGRVDGDLAVEVGAGANFGPRDPRFAGDLRLRYLSTAGAFGTYEHDRAIAMGIELRPLFLARWLTGHYSGNPRLDLGIDSLGFELGAVFLKPDGGHFGDKPGLTAGLGIELPIFPNATGPFIALHGGARWSDQALSGGPLYGPSDRSLFLNVVVAWQQVFGAHVADLGDRRP